MNSGHAIRPFSLFLYLFICSYLYSATICQTRHCCIGYTCATCTFDVGHGVFNPHRSELQSDRSSSYKQLCRILCRCHFCVSSFLFRLSSVLLILPMSGCAIVFLSSLTVFQSFYLCVSSSVYLSLCRCLSVSVFLSLSVYVSVSVSLCLFLCFYLAQSVCLCLSDTFFLSVRLSVCQPVGLCLSLNM